MHQPKAAKGAFLALVQTARFLADGPLAPDKGALEREIIAEEKIAAACRQAGLALFHQYCRALNRVV